MTFPDPVIFDSLVTLQAKYEEHATALRRELAAELRKKSSYYRRIALECYSSVEEQARLEGMGDAFAIAADMVDVRHLETVS